MAVSGGLDSSALLHCVVRAAAPLGIRVHALHVHHGLQPDADRWLAHVAAQCRRYARSSGADVQFHAARLTARPARGDSIEAWARRERYRALAALAGEAGCGIVLLAQHRRDQAETVLLQALRGAGPAGLAAMPRAVERDGILWVRPWLDQPRRAIEAYVRRWRLTTIHDPSNDDPRYARSRLRQQVWPAFEDAFPDAEGVLATLARRAAEAREILLEAAAQDRLQVCDDDGALHIDAWSRLSAARRANVLRFWLGETGAAVPETLVRRLLDELPGKTLGQWPSPAGPLRLRRGSLRRDTLPG